MLNTSLRKPIRMQDFIQLCDSFWYNLINNSFSSLYFCAAIDPKKPVQMAYVPGHLYHMLFELLKVGPHYVVDFIKKHFKIHTESV